MLSITGESLKVVHLGKSRLFVVESSFIGPCCSTWKCLTQLNHCQFPHITRHSRPTYRYFFICWGHEHLSCTNSINRLRNSRMITFLSGDACTRELWRFPLLSFFSGVQTPGSVWVERSDSAESPALFFQTEVPLLCSVSLLCGKTKVSSSEPARENKTSVVYWVHLIRRGILGVTYMMGGTYSSCCPWFLSQVQGYMGRIRLCFCVSLNTPFPLDLYSVCDSLSHSLRVRERETFI